LVRLFPKTEQQTQLISDWENEPDVSAIIIILTFFLTRWWWNHFFLVWFMGKS